MSDDILKTERKNAATEDTMLNFLKTERSMRASGRFMQTDMVGWIALRHSCTRAVASARRDRVLKLYAAEPSEFPCVTFGRWLDIKNKELDAEDAARKS